MKNNAVQEALGLGSLQRGTVSKYEHAIEHREFDLELYDDVKALSQTMDVTVEEGNNKLKTFSNLSEDIFMNLFKFNPQMRDQAEMLPSRTFNYNMLSELSDTPEFQKLRDMCKLNMLNSAIGTEIIHNEALSKIDVIIEEYKKKTEEAKSQGVDEGNLPQSILDQINQMAANEQNNSTPIDDTEDPFGSNTQGPGGGSVSINKQAAQQLAEEANKLQQSNEMAKVQQAMTEAIRQATKTALDDVTEISEFIDAWGLEGGDGQRVSVDSVKSALSRIRNSEELKKLTKILGRFRSIAKNNLKKKSKGEAGSVKNVTCGRDLVKMLPTEKGLISNAATKPLFYKKYNEKQLLQYEVEHNKRKGMGPIVVCLDISGSMSGKKLEWGKAVALALLEVALKQKRNYSLFMFSTYIKNSWEILKGEADPNTIIDIASIGCGGGTNFNVPVEKAMSVILNSKDFKKADITFITDGDCSLTRDKENELIELKAKKNIKVQTIVIDAGGHCSTAGVENWSDKITKVSKLADLNDDLASEIFNLSIDDGGDASGN